MQDWCFRYFQIVPFTYPLFNKSNKYTSFFSFAVIKKILFSFVLSVFFLAGVYTFAVFNYFLQITFLKNLAIWFSVLFLIYWICAAVWCLYDKDDYGRNVSASDDFYNIAFTSIWLVEGFLLSLFLSYSKMFDYYDAFLESEERESSYRSEDAESSTFTSLFTFVVSIQISLFVLDSLSRWESQNPYWLSAFLGLVLLWLVVSFITLSVKFLEEFDFEEDGEDLYDSLDNVFEHEDFPENNVDGGDYKEGYEILQLFFGFWHYMFITLHLLYIIYSVYSSKGKQTNVYWAVVAICQNFVLLAMLDIIDWAEVLLDWTSLSIDNVYSWFYINEDPTNTTLFYFQTITQLLETGVEATNKLLTTPISELFNSVLYCNSNSYPVNQTLEEYLKIAHSLPANTKNS